MLKSVFFILKLADKYDWLVLSLLNMSYPHHHVQKSNYTFLAYYISNYRQLLTHDLQMIGKHLSIFIYIYIYGIWQLSLFRATYKKCFKVSINKHILILVH